MFVSFLLPYIDRGYGPLFHWVMLRQLASFGPEQVAFIGDERYFAMDAPWGEEGEILGFKYRCPSPEAFEAVRKQVLPCGVFEELDRRSKSMLEAYRILLTEVYPPLKEALVKILDQLTREGDVEAILSWCTLPTLSAAAAEFGLPVIHNELGPLRPPRYQPTVYLDFEGVNGGTSAQSGMDRFVSERGAGFEPLSLSELRSVFRREPAPAALGTICPVGVALQVEDDSNLLAFSGGLTNFDLIYAARKRLSADQVLIRRHPHGHLDYNERLGTRDASPDSETFLSRCEALWTINSSVAFEALLLGKPVRVFGDSPVAGLSAERIGALSDTDRLLCLNYIFLGYLVPAEFLFDTDYYRWRLSRPSWGEVCRRHLEFYRQAGSCVAPSPTEGTEPARPVRRTGEGAEVWVVPKRYSFLENFESGRVASGEIGQAAIWQVVLEERSTEAIYLQPPAKLVFEIPTGAAGQFVTAVTIHPEAWEKPGAGGCEFHVQVDGRVAFVLAIDPVTFAADRSWHELRLPIPESVTGRHQVILETRAVGVGSDFRWAVWRDPWFGWQGPPVDQARGSVDAPAVEGEASMKNPEECGAVVASPVG